jgi:release factor glutamine methyltransferase
MTAISIYQKQTQFSLLLQNTYSKEEADSITTFVFSELLKMGTLQLRMNKNQLLTAAETEMFDTVLSPLLKHEPVQYVLGVAYFYGLRFIVNENVLIPRRETEELVELILKQTDKPNPRIIDIGTGSGCIAITLKKNKPTADVMAIDYSKNAIAQAKLNALALLQKDKEKKFLERDIFDRKWWQDVGKFDVVVSNPPYVTVAEKQQMQANVLNYEPHSALFVPDETPLLYYDAIADFASQTLENGGKLYFEINEQFGPETIEMLRQKGFTDIGLHKDMQRKNRITVASWVQ